MTKVFEGQGAPTVFQGRALPIYGGTPMPEPDISPDMSDGLDMPLPFEARYAYSVEGGETVGTLYMHLPANSVYDLGNADYVSISGTQTVNELPAADWYPITLGGDGKVWLKRHKTSHAVSIVSPKDNDSNYDYVLLFEVDADGQIYQKVLGTLVVGGAGGTSANLVGNAGSNDEQNTGIAVSGTVKFESPPANGDSYMGASNVKVRTYYGGSNHDEPTIEIGVYYI